MGEGEDRKEGSRLGRREENIENREEGEGDTKELGWGREEGRRGE
jgi:hypothetical protein